VIGSRSAREGLAAFAQQLQDRGFRVAGVLQQTHRDPQGRKLDMALVDVTTGAVRSFSQKLGRGSQSCTVDEQALCRTAGDLAHALSTDPDLVIFSKFGPLECEGRGFRQEFAQALAAGLPVLSTVPADAVKGWLTFTGGQGRVLSPERSSLSADLWAWWGPYGLYADLAAAARTHSQAATARCLSLQIGPRWLMVQGPEGCGVAPLPAQATTAECAALTKAAQDQPLAALAQTLPPSSDFVPWWGAPLALAAFNALFNTPRQTQPSAPTAPPAEAILDPTACLFGLDPPPQARLYDDIAALAWHDTSGEEVILPAWGLAARQLPLWLRSLGPNATVTLSGAATPLCDRLGAYGLHRLHGVLFPDADRCAKAISDPTCTDSTLAACGQQHLLQAP
jgi:nucleoside-triphosphatase THEP1